jgi:hypothetical protein
MKITNDGRAPALVDTVVDYARIEIDTKYVYVAMRCLFPEVPDACLCSDFGHPAQCPAKQTATWAEHGVSRVSR